MGQRSYMYYLFRGTYGMMVNLIVYCNIHSDNFTSNRTQSLDRIGPWGSENHFCAAWRRNTSLSHNIRGGFNRPALWSGLLNDIIMSAADQTWSGITVHSNDWMGLGQDLQILRALSLPFSITHTLSHTHKWREVMLPCIKISHLLKLVPHHLLLLRHRGGKEGRGEERKNYISSFHNSDTVFSAAAARSTADSTISLIALCAAISALILDMLSQKKNLQYVKPDTPAVKHNIQKVYPGFMSRP